MSTRPVQTRCIASPPPRGRAALRGIALKIYILEQETILLKWQIANNRQAVKKLKRIVGKGRS
jgi:hypothetical protein